MAGHSKSRTLRVYTVDSFSSVPFAGNPAAVCPLEEDISDELKQKIARELNISETAFVDIGKKKHSSSVAPTYPLRWFTPTTEVPLCGHATLATAHVLFSQNYVNGDTVSFQTMRGLLTVKKKEDGSLQMDFPQGAPSAVKIREPLQKEMIERLGLKDAAIVDVQYCAPNRKLLVHVERDETSAGSGKGNVPLITSLRPDNLLALQWDLDMDVRGIIVTTQPTLEDEERWRSFHVVSRYFAPWNGIPEDPVTGSAHTVIGVYWAEKLQKTTISAFQASERGGDLYLELLEGDRIHIRGFATLILCGTLNVGE